MINVKHLAHPKRVVSTGKVYVVWVRGMDAGDKQQNVGVLRVDRKLNGVLDTSTPLRKFELSITVEADGVTISMMDENTTPNRLRRQASPWGDIREESNCV